MTVPWVFVSVYCGYSRSMMLKIYQNVSLGSSPNIPRMILPVWLMGCRMLVEQAMSPTPQRPTSDTHYC